MALLELLVLPLAMVLLGSPSSAVGAPPTAATAITLASTGSWVWPVTGPVIQGFDPPETPYGSGHRGIDIAVAIGTTVVAPETGVVTFAGKVGGYLFVTIDHGGGLESTYSWLSATIVRKNDVVARGQPIAHSGQGHPGSSVPHVHLGVRLGDAYVDPMSYLGPMSVSGMIRLAPASAA